MLRNAPDTEILQISSTKAQTKGPRGGRAVVQNLKSNLTKPQPTWWNAAQREGLTVTSLTDEEVSAKEKRSGLILTDKKDRWWTVQYSDRYRSVTKAFVSAVMIGGGYMRLDLSRIFVKSL